MDIKFGQIKSEKVDIFDAGIIYVKAEKLFSNSKYPFNTKDWELYYYTSKPYLKLHCEFWLGIQGVEGILGLGVPSKKYNTDCWEGSCVAGAEDWWEFLGFSINTDDNSIAKLRIFYLNQTFFDEWNQIVKTIDLSIDNECHDLMTGVLFCHGPNDEDQWETLFKIFERELGAVKYLKGTDGSES